MAYDLDTSLLHRVRRASQSLESFFASSVTAITFRQFIVLEAVGKLEGTSQTGLVGMTGIDRSTMADIVRRLQKHGLITRRRSKADARAYKVQLTSTGRKMLHRGHAAAKEAEVAASRMLRQDERRVLLDLLGRLESAGQSDPAG